VPGEVSRILAPPFLHGDGRALPDPRAHVEIVHEAPRTRQAEAQFTAASDAVRHQIGDIQATLTQLDGKLATTKDIKSKVRNWQGDWMRA